MASALTQYSRAALNNALFGKTSSFGALASAPTIFVGLSSTTPTTIGGNVTEPSGGNYARVSTPGASWNSATSADPSVVSNSAIVAFAAANADWLSQANLTYFVMYDALTNGNCLGYGSLANAKPVFNGDTASFAAGQLSCQMT